MKFVADLFNLFNEQTIVRVNQYGEIGGSPGTRESGFPEAGLSGTPVEFAGSLSESVQRPFGGPFRVLNRHLHSEDREVAIGDLPFFRFYEGGE